MTTHLLIAEDSATQRAVLVADLEAAGYTVTAVADGDEALEVLHERGATIDLLISDVVMPRLDGLELCRRVKSDAALPELPVVLLTSLQDPLDIVRGLEVGADNFLTKPYEPDHLVARIETILESRAEPSEEGAVTYLQLLGQRFAVTAERQQILELLVGAFEDLVHANQQLRERELELAEARSDLARRLAQVEHERARLAAVLDAIPDGVLIVGPDGRITDANPALAAFGMGSDSDELIDTHIRDLPITVLNDTGRTLPPATWPLVRAYHEGEATTTGVDLRLRAVDGSSVPVTVTAAPVRNGHQAPTDAVAVVRDVSAWAFHDRLTALPNRTLFADRVERALVRADVDDGEVAVLVLSLDRFTVVHDSLGRGAEDSLVVAVARRLVGAVRADATVAQLGGDRFGILLDGIADVTHALHVADRIAEVLEQPVTLGHQEVFLTASIGIAVRTADTTAELLLRQASTAMHQAIERGGARRVVHHERLDNEARRRLFLEGALRRALDREEFVVHFQPVASLGSRRVTETEALVRWEHPEGGLVSPGEFIPIAETSGLIIPLGRWVLQQACRQTQAWRDTITAAADLRVSVNLSARQLEDPDLAGDVRDALAASGLPAGALTLEVTESALIREPKRAATILEGLRELGVRIAIDDFGTGYSSLSYLRVYPLDVLKIDRSFVQQVAADEDAAAIARVIISLATSLGLDVIAEGVETPEQLTWLREAGCQHAAGYLLCRPMTAVEVAPHLAGELVSEETSGW